MSDTTTFSLRVDNALLERIDAAATLRGMKRTPYIISWLPENYDSHTETTPDQAAQGERVVQSRRRSSPAPG